MAPKAETEFSKTPPLAKLKKTSSKQAIAMSMKERREVLVRQRLRGSMIL